MIFRLYFILNICFSNQFFFLYYFIIICRYFFYALFVILYNHYNFFNSWNTNYFFLNNWHINYLLTNFFDDFIIIDYNWFLRNNLNIFRNFNYFLFKALYFIHLWDFSNYRNYLFLNHCNLLYSFLNQWNRNDFLTGDFYFNDSLRKAGSYFFNLFNRLFRIWLLNNFCNFLYFWHLFYNLSDFFNLYRNLNNLLDIFLNNH